jgi:hypothetical protein
MYRFAGRQFRGAMRVLRQEKRREAEERHKQFLARNSKSLHESEQVLVPGQNLEVQTI